MKLIHLLILLSPAVSFSQTECESYKLYDKLSIYKRIGNQYGAPKDTFLAFSACFSKIDKTLTIRQENSKNYSNYKLIEFWEQDGKYNYEALTSKSDTVYITVHNDASGYYLDMVYSNMFMRHYSKK